MMKFVSSFCYRAVTLLWCFASVRLLKKLWLWEVGSHKQLLLNQMTLLRIWRETITVTTTWVFPPLQAHLLFLIHSRSTSSTRRATPLTSPGLLSAASTMLWKTELTTLLISRKGFCLKSLGGCRQDNRPPPCLSSWPSERFIVKSCVGLVSALLLGSGSRAVCWRILRRYLCLLLGKFIGNGLIQCSVFLQLLRFSYLCIPFNSTFNLIRAYTIIVSW